MTFSSSNSQPGNSFRFVLATRKDLDQLQAIELAAFTWDRFSRQQFLYLIQRAKAVFTIALEQEVIVGYFILLYRNNCQHMRLYSIAVNPQCVGRGIGQQLLEQAIMETQTKGFPRIRLEVRKDNFRAIKMYEKNGFRVIREIPNYYEDSEPAVSMELDL